MLEVTQQVKHSSVNEDYRVVLIPKDMVDFIKEKLRKDVLWAYDEESKERTLIKRPDSCSEALPGLGEEMWKEIGGTD